MRTYRLTALLGALTLSAACGSSSSVHSATQNAAGADGSGATLSDSKSLTSSKIAQQSTSSVQSQSDQSETATSGTDDGSGTSKRADQHHGGVLGVHPSIGAILGSGPITADFNVTLDFNAYLGPNAATSNGAMSVGVRHGMGGDCNIVITGNLTETFAGDREIHQTTNPNVRVEKQGTRAAGKVIRRIDGIVRRTLTAAQNANENFDLLINHAGTQVTDIYADSTLASRAITGTIQVTDETTQATATVTFNNVTRPAPADCLCPTSGSITVAIASPTLTESSTHTFTSTCGQVKVTGTSKVGAAVAASAATTSASSSTQTGAAAQASAGTTIDETVTWGYCLPQ